MHVSQRTRELFAPMLPMILAAARQVADPDAALVRFEQFVNAYGSRGLLYELLVRHPRLVEMLIRLGDASRYLAETMAREPDLFDVVCRSSMLSDPKHLGRMCDELAAAAGANSDVNPLEAVRQWKRAELLRIGIEDVMGLVDLEGLCRELTCLAEACLRFVLEAARRELKLSSLPFSISSGARNWATVPISMCYSSAAMVQPTRQRQSSWQPR